MFCLIQFGHPDLIFGLAWLDDEFVVSGSRDTSLALWKIADILETTTEASTRNSITGRSLSGPNEILASSSYYSSLPSYSSIKAVAVKDCKSAKKVRDLVFNKKLVEIACVSSNGYIHIWSADRFVQVREINEL